METEQQLLSAIRSGDRKALQRLYERFAGHATAVGLRYVPDADGVRDVVQEGFIKVFTSLDRFSYRGEGSLKAWISRIVAHQAIDYVREHERFFISDHIPDEAEEEEPDVEQVPPDILTTLIGGLPSGYRTVLNLYVFERLTHKEIGRLLGIKPETSASQYSRAKNMLAKRIKDYLKTGKL